MFLPVKSVGLIGDGRNYEYVVALRAAQKLDFMTAQWALTPTENCPRCSTTPDEILVSRTQESK